jgi:hypothetical protein
LLPWFALTAQLPYQTDSRINDIWSFCLAVGSPALVSYSLCLTLLNRSWINKRFDQLKEEYFNDGHNIDKFFENKDEISKYKSHVDGAQALLQDGQQIPLRLSQENGWLSSLIALPENKAWWQSLHEILNLNRRHFTFSIIAQVLLALTSWVLTYVSAWTSKSGSASIALSFSGASLWLWLVCHSILCS